MESKTYEKHKGDSDEWVPYIKGPEIIRRRASEIKVVEPFQKRKKKEKRSCGDLLMLKDGKKEVKPERGRGDNGHVYKSDGLERGASSAARLSFAVQDESGAPLLFFHLLLCSFITSSLEPN